LIPVKIKVLGLSGRRRYEVRRSLGTGQWSPFGGSVFREIPKNKGVEA
jgi:hypothetical protein